MRFPVIEATNRSVAVGLVILFTLVALWLPFGFSMGGLVEEWGILGLYIRKGLFFVVTPASPLGSHALRPLTVFPHALAYFLDANSFYYWHVLLILALILKAVSSCALIWQATKHLKWALLAGILILLYPADAMQFPFRSFHINWSVALSLFSSALFLGALQQKKQIFACLLTILAGLLFTVSAALYEAAFVFVGLPFLMLYVREGRAAKEILSQQKGLLFVWFGIIGLYLLYLGWVSLHIESYQVASLGEQHFTFMTLIRRLSYLFKIGMLRTVLGGWLDAFGILFTEFGRDGYLYLILVTGLISFALFLIDDVSANDTCWNRLGKVSLILMLLGYLPFISSVAHVSISQRTYLFASVGGAMFWTAVLAWLSRWKKRVAFGITVGLILLGFSAQLFQFHHYVTLSAAQKRELRPLIKQWDGQLGDKSVHVMDDYNALNHVWMFLAGDFEGALSYFYNRPFQLVQMCHLLGDKWHTEMGSSLECTEETGKKTFIYTRGHTQEMVPLNPGLKSYQQQLLHGNTPSALRFQHILQSSPWLQHFKTFWATAPASIYRFHCGTWWGLENAVSSYGWHDAGWDVYHFFQHEASIWKYKEDAFLSFDLKDKPETYAKPTRLSGEIKNILTDSIKKSLKISINQHPLNYHWLAPGKFEALIPAGTLKPGLNHIKMYALLDPKLHVSFRLKTLQITPER